MKKRPEYLAVILFFASYLIFSFNIQNQGIYIDELFHHTFGMVYFDSFVKGDLLNPCITGKGECSMINLECAGQIQWLASGGLIKGLFVGLGDNLFSHHDRIYYAGFETCRPIHNSLAVPGVNIPTQSELAAARFFSPIFGSLTVVVTYMTGKFLYSRNLGLFASLMLMFYSLWMLHSRILTSEVYVNFFMMLALCVLLYSTYSKNIIKTKYLILSAVVFGLAINTKLTIIETAPVFIFLIFFRNNLRKSIDWRTIKEKLFMQKSILLTCIFIAVTFVTIISTFPFYYIGPIEQLKLQYDGMIGYGGINEPWNPTKSIFIPIGSAFSVTIAPLYDTYYKLVDPQNIPISAVHGHTFTSIPLSILFLTGFIFIILKLKTKTILLSELMVLVWYISVYIFTSLTAESYNQSRYFLPLAFPMIIIASYGFLNVVRGLPRFIQISFAIVSLSSHIITYLIFWSDIYFNPQKIWRLPLYFNLQKSLEESYVLILGLIFVFTMIIIFLHKFRNKLYWNENDITKH